MKKSTQAPMVIVKDERVNFSVAPDVMEKARAKSKKTGVSMSFIVEKALRAWVEKRVDNK